MKKTLGLLLTAMLLAAGCRSLAPVYNVENKTVALASGVTMEQAILAGGAAKRWTMSSVRPGLVKGHLYARGHEVTVNIPYTQNSYSIEYASSGNMHYNAKKHKIHPKYNQWIRNLDLAISREAARVH